jgi:mono/diheme cytochrome c family protein
VNCHFYFTPSGFREAEMRRTTWVLLAAALLPAFAGTAMAAADGAEVYKRCLACHKADGTGIPGVFPPLVGHAAEIAKAEGGRAYLIDVVLYGLAGEIQVAGRTYKTTMPGLGGQINDEEVAAVLNRVLTSWGNEKQLPKGHKAITAPEVKARRAVELTPAKVHEARAKLGLK